MFGFQSFAAVSLSLALAACDVGGPGIEPLEDRVVAVGEEVIIEVQGTTHEGRELTYQLTSNHPRLGDRVTLAARPDGTGVFRWTPAAYDVGTWVFDFTARDDEGAATESMTIEVRSAIGANTIPLFQRPVGAGTAVDMTRSECIEVDVLASDQDSLSVTFAEEEPRIPGGELVQQGDLAAMWRWCPSPEQRERTDRYLLTLSADDGDNPVAIKRYQIILREQDKGSCDGVEPLVEHLAEDRTSVNDLEVEARVFDETGLRAAPLLYYSTTAPADPPELRSMIQLNMELASGDYKDGRWKATIPNPVASAAPGSRQTLYYLVVAEDNDGLGVCNHVATARFEMAVSSPGGDGELGLCSGCTADNQCGGPDDHCLRVGVEGAAFCMAGCAGDGDCPEGYLCSAAELESIDGARGRQCVPESETCLPAAGACSNDSMEPNDSQEQAQPLEPGESGDLALCPVGAFGGEDDWYRIELAEEGTLEVTLDGAALPDMDLDLVDESGQLVSLTWETGSADRLSACLPAGTYFVRAFSYFAGENRYSLVWSADPGACAEEDDWWAICWDDVAEEDDGADAARWVDLDEALYRDAGNQICSGDDDWYELYLYEGEVLHATLGFELAGPGQDLDFHVHDAGGADLTPCSVEDPWGCSDNGQSSGAGEAIEFTAAAEGTHYLVVRGWAEAENAYDLCASLSDTACP
jgi:hypothetical protein